MKLFDVNIPIHAHRGENRDHVFYNQWLTKLLQSQETFLYCESVLCSFIRIVTHPKIYRTPTPFPTALAFADEIRNAPCAVGIMPGARHWQIFSRLCRETNATGGLISDVYLAALAIEADAERITADEDFVVFQPELKLCLLRP